VAKDTIEGTRL
jgi:hypothetical protein